MNEPTRWVVVLKEGASEWYFASCREIEGGTLELDRWEPWPQEATHLTEEQAITVVEGITGIDPRCVFVDLASSWEDLR